MIFTFFITPEKAHYVSEQRARHESGLEPWRHRAKQAVKQVLTAIGPFLSVSIVIFMRFFRLYLLQSGWILDLCWILWFNVSKTISRFLFSAHPSYTRRGCSRRVTKAYTDNSEIDADPTSSPNAARRKIVKRISRSKLQLKYSQYSQMNNLKPFRCFIPLADLFRDVKPRVKASENYYRGANFLLHEFFIFIATVCMENERLRREGAGCRSRMCFLSL